MKRLLLVILLLAACATVDKQHERMNARLGLDIKDIIKDKGLPDYTQKMSDGTTKYVWTYPNMCKITFSTDNTGVIVKWSYNGDVCNGY